MERRLPFILIAAGIALFLASFLLFAAPKACAAEVANNSLDKIVTLYRDKASSWETALRNYALTLFFLLAAIEFGVSAIRLAIRGSDASEWLAELVNQVLFLGFFLALLEQFERLGQSDRGQLSHRRQSGRDLERGLEQSCAVRYFRHGPLHRLQGRRSDEPVLARLLARPHRLRACDPDLLCAHRRLSRGQPCRILCGDLGGRAA